DDVQNIMRTCHAFGVPVVPQGGNTGRCGGATPMDAYSVLLGLDRLDRIEAIDTRANIITVQAGCILANVQSHARDHGRLFALSLGAEGSCQIGGNIATNAGGINVLRYGNMREQVLGLEIVLADGQIWDGMRALHKDNHGYDMKQLFIGSEGTLGVITRACLRLHTLPKQTQSAMVALNDPEAALALFASLQKEVGPVFSAFELIPKRAFVWLARHMPALRLPFSHPPAYAILLRAISYEDMVNLTDALQAALQQSWQKGIVQDAIIAQSQAQEADFWKIREVMVAVQKYEGRSIKHDIAVPLHQVAQFLRLGEERVRAIYPCARIYGFGHLGDGNIH
ncbi:MAG: FAD-binding oxidoreductase, partial [Pseudomonadota bacterium]